MVTPRNSPGEDGSILGRIAGFVAAGGALYGMTEDWIILRGLGGLFGGGVNCFELLLNASYFFWPLIFTIGGTFISLFVIGYAIARQDDYNNNRRSLAQLRGIAAGVAILPVFYTISWINNFDGTQYIDGGSLENVLSSIGILLTPIEVGPGANITWVTLLIITGEAAIDYFRDGN